MALDKKPLVQPQDFPSQLTSDEEKCTDEYGLKIGQAIQYQWFKRSGNSCRYYDQWTDFHRLRLYARGEQPVTKYKQEMAVNGDLSKLNLDWTPVPIVPKFVDIVVNGMSNRLFSPKAKAQDALSAKKRNDYQTTVQKDMLARPLLEQVEKEFGINTFNVPKEDLPETDEELQLHMQLKYKPRIEIAAETAISNVFDMNEYNEVKQRFDYDVCSIGWGVVKHWYSHGEGIKIDYVDPQTVVHSYTEDPNFKDVFYWGEVKQIPITELKKIKPGITNEELEEIAKTSTSWSNEYSIMRPYRDDVFQKEVVNVLFFNYKTDKKFVWKEKLTKNNGKKVKRRESTFAPPESEDAPFKRIEKIEDVWYEGVLVLGTDKLLKWELMRNMVKPDATFQFVNSNYVAVAPRMYKGNIESLVRRMIPFADMIQLTHLKLQQIQARMIPDGAFIDADGINEVDLGNGGEYSPQDALDLYFQTGSVIGRSSTQDGDFNNGRVPIQELNSSSGQSKMAALINNYNHYLNMIRDVTGLNEARDGSSPDPRSLVGLQKMAALNSNTATRHILDAGLYATKKLAECVSLRISDVLQYADNREEFANQIGDYNVSMLEEIKNLPLSSFGIYIEVSPDAEDIDKLEKNIDIALNRDQIGLEDAMDIREIKNLKTANALLKLKKKNKEKKDAEAEQMKVQMQTASNIQSAQAAAEAKMQQSQLEVQGKIAVANAETEGKLRLMEYEVQAKERLMDLEFQYNMSIESKKSEDLRNREDHKEDRKDKRVDKQSTQTSKIAHQKQVGSGPINFESSEDSLDGFDLSEFSPR